MGRGNRKGSGWSHVRDVAAPRMGTGSDDIIAALHRNFKLLPYLLYVLRYNKGLPKLNLSVVLFLVQRHKFSVYFIKECVIGLSLTTVGSQ